ncbi:MAG: hypothetical protein E7638_04145 [Ruminococcaceae bacterium]|nr:hypothetical protein [Oscillospiraceae bacterium]
MKLFKRITVLVFAVLYLTMSMIVPASAAAGVIFILSDGEAATGESVTVELSISAVSVWMWGSELVYDKNALTFEGFSEPGTALSGALLWYLDDENEKITASYKAPGSVYSNVCKLTFTVNENAEPGKYPIYVAGSANTQIIDENGKRETVDISVMVSHGTITVLPKTPLETEAPETDDLTDILGDEVKKFYGVEYNRTDTNNEKTKKENRFKRIKAKAKSLMEEFDEQLRVLKEEMEKLTQTEESIETLAERLRQRDAESDNPALILPKDMPEDVVEAVYKAYAEYLKMITDKGIEINKINLDDKMIKINKNIIKNIQDELVHDTNYAITIDGWRISFNNWAPGGLAQGSVTAKRGTKVYMGGLNTEPDKVVEVVQDYANDLRDVTYDVMKQAVNSILSDLADETGYSEWEKNEIKESLKEAEDMLKENGLGEVYKTAEKIRQGYEIIEKITSCLESDSFDELLENSEDYINQLKNLDFSDDAVSNAAMQRVLNKINSLKNDLINQMEDYATGQNITPDKKEGFFDKVKSFFTSSIQCPVDFEVLDENGDLIGYVLDGDMWHDESIFIDVSGDVKQLYVPSDMTVNLNLIPTDEGEMNYVVEKYENGFPVERYNYYDLPLTEGNYFTQAVSAVLFEESEEPMLSNAEEDFLPDCHLTAEDENAFASITVECGEGGMVLGGGDYPLGDSVALTAQSTADYTYFLGWFIGDEIVSIDRTYRFTARENMTVRCEFVEILPGNSYLKCKGSSEYLLKGGYVLDVLAGTTVSDFLTQFESKNVSVIGPDSEIAEGAALIGTGCTIRLTDDDGSLTDEATVVVKGDTTGDSNVDIADALLLFRHSMLPDLYTTLYPANYLDFTKDGDIDIRDARLLFQYSMLPDVYPIA